MITLENCIKKEIIDIINNGNKLPLEYIQLLFPHPLYNFKWDIKNTQMKGKYSEYFAKLVFIANGYEIYSTDVDDHGVDFICKKSNGSNFYQIQVKSVFESDYVFVKKSKMPPHDLGYICLLHFMGNAFPIVYIIPVKAWGDEKNGHKSESSALKYYEYGADKKSVSEFGISLTKKALVELKRYDASIFFNENSI